MGELVAIKGDVASQIGKLYRHGIDSWRRAGELLMAQRAALSHGQWLPWLEANADKLGFSSPRTAQRLLELAKCDVNDAFDLWGNSGRPVAGGGSIEWYTPAEHIALVREVMGGIDLDPASSTIAQDTVRATTFYTVDTDGLSQQWHGRVWLNPPYSMPSVAHFAEKLVSSLPTIAEAIVLTNSATDTAWFHLLAHKCSAVCFTRGRIQFQGAEGMPMQGQSFFYFGSNVAEFIRLFRGVGLVMVHS